MNPLTNVKNITKLNETELSKGTIDKKSWHNMYKDSAWIFIGGLAYGLTEGDVLAVFSQYGEIVNINLVRDKKTGKTKGFCFLCYANQKSTVLAVDNFNGIKLLSRTIRVDHVLNYKPPKDNENDDDITKQLKSEGCAPKPIKQESSPTHVASSLKKKKSKKEKKKRKKDKKVNDDESLLKKTKIKKEKRDPGYDKYDLPQSSERQYSKAKQSRVNGSESSSCESSDESCRNSKKNHKKRVSNKKSDKTHTRLVSKDPIKQESHEKFNSQKRNLEDSESDFDRDYVKQKKSRISHSAAAKSTILSIARVSEHKSKSQHNSNSPDQLLSSDDERSNALRVARYEQHNSSHSSSSKNKRKETSRHRHDSSSSEDANESNQHGNRSRERDSMKDSISSNSHFRECDKSFYQKTDNKNDKSGSGYDRDHRIDHHHYDDSKTHDQLDSSAIGKSKEKNNDQDNRWVKNTESKNYNLSHSKKYIDRDDHYSCNKEDSNHNKDSSKCLKSSRHLSDERDTKSKYRNRDDNKKDWYDRRK